MAERITPAEAQRLMEDEGYVYLDVRSVPEFEAGHPKGAYNIPIKHMGAGGMRDNPEFVTQVEKAFSKDTKIIIGCKAGGRSKAAAERLATAGFEHLKDQCAGWGGLRDRMGRLEEKGWAAHGLPSATEAEEGRDHESLAGSEE